MLAEKRAKVKASGTRMPTRATTSAMGSCGRNVLGWSVRPPSKLPREEEERVSLRSRKGQRAEGKRDAHDEDEADVADDEEGLHPCDVEELCDGPKDDADGDLAEETCADEAVCDVAGDLGQVEERDEDGEV